MRERCGWAKGPQIMVAYHDTEWGVPVHDDRLLFEFLVLEGAQAGLSWLTVLQKRENYRKAFDDFDPEKVANYGDDKIERLLTHGGIIRNRRKIEAAIVNARAFQEIRASFGDFDAYIWGFVGGRPICNRWKSIDQVPAETKESNEMSRDLKKRGFAFVGPTICYAFMQAVGMANDHLVRCFRHEEICRMYP